MTVMERSKGWPADRMSKVLPAFVGRTIACLASGPSLTAEQVEILRVADIPVLACNDCYRIAPFAALVYFADSKWHDWQKDKPEWKAFAGDKVTIHSSSFRVTDPQVHVLHNRGHEGLSNDPSGIMTGSHSGYQLINIAALTKPSRILLLGYDCKRVNGRKHFFGDHPDGTEPPYEGIKKHYSRIEVALKGMALEIINCTPDSAIDSFPKRSLESVLAHTPAAMVSV